MVRASRGMVESKLAALRSKLCTLTSNIYHHSRCHGVSESLRLAYLLLGYVRKFCFPDAAMPIAPENLQCSCLVFEFELARWDKNPSGSR